MSRERQQKLQLTELRSAHGTITTSGTKNLSTLRKVLTHTCQRRQATEDVKTDTLVQPHESSRFCTTTQMVSVTTITDTK
jgi:hypothetical protein